MTGREGTDSVLKGGEDAQVRSFSTGHLGALYYFAYVLRVTVSFINLPNKNKTVLLRKNTLPSLSFFFLSFLKNMVAVNFYVGKSVLLFLCRF